MGGWPPLVSAAHKPLAGRQPPELRQAEDGAGQTTPAQRSGGGLGIVPTHTPLAQASPSVAGSRSSHGVPSGAPPAAVKKNS